jgi:hypothetical protein
MQSGTSRRSPGHRRCTHCGRFIGGSAVDVCSRCQATRSIDQRRDPPEAPRSGSEATEFGRTMADLGLDTRFLSDPTRRSTQSLPDHQPTVLREPSYRVAPPAMPPPVGALRESLLMHARRDSILARSVERRPRPIDNESGPSDSVPTVSEPAVAPAIPSDGRGALLRRLYAKARSSARQIAVTAALICLSVLVGASVPLLLSLVRP